MEKKMIIIALMFGAIAIVLGAFAAHGLKNKLDSSVLSAFETAVRYQMYHALYLLFFATTNVVSETTKTYVFYLVVAGVLLFSGSIYLLSTQAITQINFKKIGFITPIGGLLLVVSWVLPIYKLIMSKL